MKKVIRIIGGVLVGLLILVIVIYKMMSTSLPSTETGDRADELAQKMLSSLNYTGYKSLSEISWGFMSTHQFVWNKKDRTVLVETEDATVLLSFNDGAHEVLKSNDLSDEELIEVAIANFYNDSFWLVAPFKVMDKGVERGFIETEDGPGLLVTYNSGGVTPGDSYLWILDENYRPKYWRVWTSNISIDGMKFKWKEWEQHNGIWFATEHPSQVLLSIDISDLRVK